MANSLGLSKAAVTLLFLSSISFPVVEPASSSLLTDKEALLSLKAALTNPSDPLPSWNASSSSVCEWTGVSCDSLRQRVSSLDLQGLGLQGSLSPHLTNLSFLSSLYLQNNQLSGSLPDQICDLSQLQVLNISSNQIKGAIPPNISRCKELTAIDLSRNSISGKIPGDLDLLPKLQSLVLSQNMVAGAIPPSIGNISSLITLDIAANFISGSIPSNLGRLTSLQRLELSINNLTGTVPPSLYNISSLVKFDIASNHLHGEIPDDIGFKLPNLLTLHICLTDFSGKLPPSLYNLTKIQSLRLSHNFLTGSVPPGLGSLRHLTIYTIGYNLLESSGGGGLDFITELTNCPNLQHLSIEGNRFEGVIPDSIGNLSTSLSKVFMAENRISGTIPPSIARLTGLTLLNMSSNSISGPIPPEILQLSNLRVLGLAGNSLSGEIPAGIGSLSKLIRLDLSGNGFEGSIPRSFGNLQDMLSLDLSSNKLTGSIPEEVFSITSLSLLLNLSGNQLSGPLPQEVGRLQNVATIDISDNLLSGSIPGSIGNCISLQDLSLSGNSFSGSIPDTIGNLKGLQSLDLSSNQLSGSIPSDLGELRVLQFLNLSFNNLKGDIPKDGVFKVASNVHLDGNTGLCSLSSSSSCEENGAHRSISTALEIAIITVASVIACLVVVLVSWLLLLLLLHRRGGGKVLTVGGSFRGQHSLVSYEELHRATDNFSSRNIIGSGTYGSVYRGVLKDGMEVAIKVMNLEISGAWKSFVAECETLRNVRHRNLIKLATSCSSLDFSNTEFLALIYEFISNGSLADWLRGRRMHYSGESLSVVERLNIAIDVASALDYLHNDCKPPIAHCDLKPSNVLLNEEMTAKVGDFGLARTLLERPGDSIITSSVIKGTIGYIPPEYGMVAKPSTRGDVYSFGIMVVELLTAKSPTDEGFEGEQSLVKWVCSAFPGKVREVIDPNLLLENTIIYKDQVLSLGDKQKCLTSMLAVALSCAVESPEERMNIRDALYRLKDIKSTLMQADAVYDV